MTVEINVNILNALKNVSKYVILSHAINNAQKSYFVSINAKVNFSLILRIELITLFLPFLYF